MNCRKFEKNVVALLEKTLPRSTEESLEEHRRECEDCASLAATLEQILQEDLPAGNEALSNRFWPVLLERVREHDSQGFTVGRLGLRPLALTACFFLAVWAGIHLGDAYVNRALAPSGEEYAPFLIVLDDIPRDSLAELVLQESVQVGSEQ